MPMVASGLATEASAPSSPVPLLEPGDRLSREEFERRYERMPDVQKAELIEGIVYLPSPAHARKHSGPQRQLAGWLMLYESETPGVESFVNSTVRLDLGNEPQPDLALLKLAAKGGQARMSEDDYIARLPELLGANRSRSTTYGLLQNEHA